MSVTFNKEKELARIAAKVAEETANAESKALTIETLPDAILSAAKFINAGVYSDVLANVSLEAETLADAIALMNTSNAIVSRLYVRGTFSSFPVCDDPKLTTDRNYSGTTQTSINPWTLKIDYLANYGDTARLHWFSEYGNHRFRFECKINRRGQLPSIAVVWRKCDGQKYIYSTHLVNLPPGCRSCKYANIQPNNVGNAVIYFPASNNSPWEDFGIAEPGTEAPAADVESTGGSC